MEKDTERPEVTGKKQDTRFKKGQSGNPAGRPKGSESFATKWYRMVEKIADTNDLTTDQVEEELLKVGYKRAKDGDYSFYRDVMDRIHGKPMQRTELTGADGKELFVDKAVKEEVNTLIAQHLNDRDTKHS